MKFNCAYCHTPTTKSDNIIKMCCICDDDIRFIKIDEILSGFYNDKVYLLADYNIYDKNKSLHPTLSNVG